MLLLGLGRDDGGEAGARGGDARLGGVVRARGAVERQLVCDEGVVRRHSTAKPCPTPHGSSRGQGSSRGGAASEDWEGPLAC